ncbi:MAG: hypothetical protein ACM30E_03255 [Nitrososphaerales archaeon]
MGRRHRRRQDTDWTPLLIVGLTALFSALRGRREPAFGERELPSPFRPLFTLVGLIAAFVALGVLLTVLSAVAALGGGGALTVACGVPLMLVGFVAWMIARSKQPQTATGSDPWTIDGTASEVSQGTPEAATKPGGSAVAAAPAQVPPLAAPMRRAPVHQEPSHHAGKTAARVQPVPERPPRSPAEYRQRAASYRRKIQSLIRMRRPGPISERMTGVLQKLKSWEDRVGQLADRLTLYERDDLIQRDVRETPVQIERLRRQLALEAEPEMQRQVQRTLAAYEEQQRQLELLAKVMKRTRLNLDDTLAAMGTVYSQLQVLNAMDIDGPTAARIAGDVDREVERLNDLMAAMSDVYSESSETPQQPASSGAVDEDAGLSERKARLGDTATN